MVDAIAARLPGAPLSAPQRRALDNSLGELAGTPLTAELVRLAVWRVTGNADRIRKRIAVPQWTHQRDAEWVPVQIVRADPCRTKYNDPATRYTFLVYAGLPAGLHMTQEWSHRFCAMVARRLGFQRRPHEGSERLPVRVYRHSSELVGMRLMVLVEPALCTAGPGFKKVLVTGSMLERNQRLMDLRDRLKPGCTCPMGLPATLHCWQCLMGYRSCPAGTHRHDRQRRQCEGCGRLALFDPEVSNDRCMACVRRALEEESQK